MYESEMAKSNAAEFLAYAIDAHRQGQVDERRAGTTANSATKNGAVPGSTVPDSLEVIEYALNTGADAILDLSDRLSDRMQATGDVKSSNTASSGVGDSEDPMIKKLRLNLLAIAKRAPLDRIGRVPADLVPQHIRHIVPTLST